MSDQLQVIPRPQGSAFQSQLEEGQFEAEQAGKPFLQRQKEALEATGQSGNGGALVSYVVNRHDEEAFNTLGEHGSPVKVDAQYLIDNKLTHLGTRDQERLRQAKTDAQVDFLLRTFEQRDNFQRRFDRDKAAQKWGLAAVAAEGAAALPFGGVVTAAGRAGLGVVGRSILGAGLNLGYGHVLMEGQNLLKSSPISFGDRMTGYATDITLGALLDGGHQLADIASSKPTQYIWGKLGFKTAAKDEAKAAVKEADEIEEAARKAAPAQQADELTAKRQAIARLNDTLQETAVAKDADHAMSSLAKAADENTDDAIRTLNKAGDELQAEAKAAQEAASSGRLDQLLSKGGDLVERAKGAVKEFHLPNGARIPLRVAAGGALVLAASEASAAGEGEAAHAGGALLAAAAGVAGLKLTKGGAKAATKAEAHVAADAGKAVGAQEVKAAANATPSVEAKAAQAAPAGTTEGGQAAKADAKSAAQAPRPATEAEIEEGAKEFDDTGAWAEHGAFRKGIFAPEGEAVYVPEIGKVARASVSVGKWSKDVGLSAGTRIGNSEAGELRYLNSLMHQNIVGLRSGRNDVTRAAVDELKATVADTFNRHNEAAMEAGRAEYIRATKGRDYNMKDQFSQADVREFNRAVADGMRGLPGVHPAAQKAADAITANTNATLKRLDALGEKIKAMNGDKWAADSKLKEVLDMKREVGYLVRQYDGFAMQTLAGKIGFKQTATVLAEARLAKDAEITAEAAQKWAEDLVMQRMAKNGDTVELPPLAMVDPSLGRVNERVDLDELMPARRVKALDGTEIEVSVRDLLANNPQALMANWSNTMHGIEALATVGLREGWDLTSSSAFNKFVTQAVQSGKFNAKHVTMLRDSWLATVGAPQDTFKNANLATRTLLTLNTLPAQKSFVFAQIADAAANLPLAAKAGFSEALPGMAELKAMLKDGKPATEFMQDLAEFTGHGLHRIPSFMQASLEHGILGKVEAAASVATSKFMKYNGTQLLNDLAVHTRSYYVLNHLVGKAANGLRELTKADWDHLRGLGINEQAWAELAPLVKKHSMLRPDGSFRRVDLDALMRESPVAGSELKVALRRAQSDAASQLLGHGASVPELTGSIGKVFTQFMGATFAANNRLRRATKRFNGEIGAMWGVSIIAAGMAHLAKSYALAGQDEEKLEKMLKPQAVFAASLRNSILSGLAFQAVDGADRMGLLPEPLDGLLTGASNSGRSSVLSVAPAERAMDIWKGGYNVLHSALYDDDVLTKGEGVGALNAVNPWLALSIGGNAIAATMLPSQNLRKPKHEED